MIPARKGCRGCRLGGKECANYLHQPHGVRVAPQAAIDNQVGDAHDDLAFANQKVNEVTKANSNSLKSSLPSSRLPPRRRTTVRRSGVARWPRRKRHWPIPKRHWSQCRPEVAKIEEEVAQIRAQIGALARVIYTTGGQFGEIQVLLDPKNPAEFTERLAALRRVSAWQ